MMDKMEMLSNQEVIDYASGHSGSQSRWLAIDELTRRALEDERLLDIACLKIGEDRAIKPHYIPYGSHLAVARILNSGKESAIRILLREMDSWTAYEQEDAISPWAGHERVAAATRELTDRYSWLPKYI